MLADVQLQVLDTTAGGEEVDEVFQGRIAGRHAAQALFVEVEFVGDGRQGGGGVEVVAQQSLAGVDVAPQESVGRLDQEGARNSGSRRARAMTVSLKSRVRVMSISCGRWFGVVCSLASGSWRPRSLLIAQLGYKCPKVKLDPGGPIGLMREGRVQPVLYSTRWSPVGPRPRCWSHLIYAPR